MSITTALHAECSLRPAGFHAACFTVALLSTSLALAGFDLPAGAPEAQLAVDGAPLGKPGNPAAAETVRKLKARFQLANDDAAKAKLEQMRRQVVNAIDLVKCVNRDIGDCLQRQLDAGRFCISFKDPGDAGRTLEDGKPECGNEPINISVQLLQCADVPLYDGIFYYMFITLLHEGRHTLQDYAAPGQPGDDDRKREVRGLYRKSCLEVEAENLENEEMARYIAALEAIRRGDGVPVGTTSAAKKIAEALAGDASLSAAQRRLRAAQLIAGINAIRASNDQRIRCENDAKAIYTMFLEGKIGYEEMMRQRARVGWYVQQQQSGARNVFYFGDGGSGVFHQTDGDADRSFGTELDAVYDVAILSGGRRAVLAGGLSGTGDGVLMRLEDIDGDGFFDPGSAAVLFLTNDLFGGVDLAGAPDADHLLAFNRESRKLCRLVDQNEDGWPDFARIVGNLDFDRFDLLSILVSDDGKVVYGFPFYGSGGDDVILRSESAAVSIDAGNGEFSPAPGINLFRQSVFVPAFSAAPLPGDLRVELSAAANALLELHATDASGRSVAVLSSTNADLEGAATLLLEQPLESGGRLQARDLTHDGASVVVLVGQPNCPGDPECSGLPFQRGNANGDALADLSDAVYILGHLFLGTPPTLPCERAGDVNDDARVDVSDSISLLGYLFLGSPAPPAPIGACGEDTTPDAQTCKESAACAP